jgi:hypothetical protein
LQGGLLLLQPIQHPLQMLLTLLSSLLFSASICLSMSSVRVLVGRPLPGIVVPFSRNDPEDCAVPTVLVPGAFGSAISAFVGAWLAARFALDRFRHEKIWERRAASYTSVLEGLHDINQWAYRSSYHGYTTPAGETPNHDFSKYIEASNAIMRKVAGESWLLSEEFRSAVDQFGKLLMETRGHGGDYFYSFAASVQKVMKELREIARRDLSVK